MNLEWNDWQLARQRALALTQAGNMGSVAPSFPIVESLNAVNNKTALHQRTHAAITTLFSTLLHQLVTAQIRVDRLDIDELKERISWQLTPPTKTA